MKTDWDSIIEEQKHLQQNIKNSKTLMEFFKDLPEDGYMRDNISKKKVLIKDCKESTLRRYVKLLKKYYTLARLPKDRKTINDKLKEIEDELKARQLSI
jgi:hypothetical protein